MRLVAPPSAMLEARTLTKGLAVTEIVVAELIQDTDEATPIAAACIGEESGGKKIQKTVHALLRNRRVQSGSGLQWQLQRGGGEQEIGD